MIVFLTVARSKVGPVYHPSLIFLTILNSIFLKYSFEHPGTSMPNFEPVDPPQAAYTACYQPNRLCMTLLLQEAEGRDLC